MKALLDCDICFVRILWWSPGANWSDGYIDGATTIYNQLMAGNPARLLRDEEVSGIYDIVNLAEPEGIIAHEFLLEDRVIEHGLCHGSAKASREDGIHSDVWRQFNCQRSHEAVQCTFAGRIHAEAGSAELAGNAG